VAPTSPPAPPAVVDRLNELAEEARRKHAAAVADQAEHKSKLDVRQATCATTAKRAAELEATAAEAKAAHAKAELVLMASRTRADLMAKRAQKYPGNKEFQQISKEAADAISKAKASATLAKEREEIMRRKADKFKAKATACAKKFKTMADAVEANNRRLQA